MNETPSKFSIKDRYFSYKIEKNIGRINFFVRILIITILLIVFDFIFFYLWANIGLFIEDIGLISNADSTLSIVGSFFIITSFIYIYIFLILIKKRFNDLSKDGFFFSGIVQLSLMGNTLYFFNGTYPLFFEGNINGSPLFFEGNIYNQLLIILYG